MAHGREQGRFFATWEELYAIAFDAAAVARLCPPQAVEDVLQESWMIAVRQIASLDPRRGSFVSWLCGIAVVRR